MCNVNHSNRKSIKNITKATAEECGVPIARQNGCISTHLMLAQKQQHQRTTYTKHKQTCKYAGVCVCVCV